MRAARGLITLAAPIWSGVTSNRRSRQHFSGAFALRKTCFRCELLNRAKNEMNYCLPEDLRIADTILRSKFHSLRTELQAIETWDRRFPSSTIDFICRQIRRQEILDTLRSLSERN
jgi:hypothetical protein